MIVILREKTNSVTSYTCYIMFVVIFRCSDYIVYNTKYNHVDMFLLHVGE